MINKKNVLGKTPDELGDKDAIHVAIVSVRAAKPISPSSKVNLNSDREAVATSSDDFAGVADPWRSKPIYRGDWFWLLLGQDAVPNVQHTWDHPQVDFATPTATPSVNATIQAFAEEVGLPYADVMAAMDRAYEKEESTPYTGPKDEEELNLDEIDDMESVWDEWAFERLVEFENYGSACCPEYSYPETPVFERVEA